MTTTDATSAHEHRRDPGSDRAGYWYDDRDGESAGMREVLSSLRAYRAAEVAMRRRTRESMAMGENELLVLRSLLAAPTRSARPVELTRYLGVSTASTTALLDRLERSGHIERVANPADRRSILVRATPRAEEEVRRTLGTMHDRMMAAVAGMTPHECRVVSDFLDRMRTAVDGVAPSDGPGTITQDAA